MWVTTPTGKHFLTVDPVTELAVERDVLGETLVGVEPDRVEAELAREHLGVCHQPAAKATALERRRDGDILDQQMIGLADRLDQGGKRAVDVEKIEAMLGDGVVVVRRHGLGLAADQRHPFGVGLPRQVADRGRRPPAVACRSSMSGPRSASAHAGQPVVDQGRQQIGRVESASHGRRDRGRRRWRAGSCPRCSRRRDSPRWYRAGRR